MKRSSFCPAVCLAALLLTAANLGGAAASAKQDFFHANVTGPVPGGFKLDVPKELGNRQLAAWGFVDVTASPFRADPTGQRDATQAIRNAVNFARDHQMVCFFPEGTYCVSDTIECIQNPVRGGNGMFWPCVLQGSRRGTRPKIVLTARSPGFDNPEQPKRVIYFWARGAGREAPPTAEQPNILFNSMFVNLDVTVEEGNPGAVAIRMVGAQGSGVQECTIDVTHGHTGLEGGCGSGGSHADVTIIGGRIGLNLTESRPGATLAGFTLIGQTETALVYRGTESLCAVGMKITSTAPGPLIVAKVPGWTPFSGQISLVDCQFDLRAGATVASSESALYLNNVYVRGAGRIVDNPDGSKVAGDPTGWVRVVDYAHGPAIRAFKGYHFDMPVYVDGQRQKGDLVRTEPVDAPPKDLFSRHIWGDGFPGFESPGAVNVKAPPYNAKGDSFTDDTDAIQRAVNEHEIVFLPKGYYRISRTIELRPATKLVGITQVFSVLMSRDAKGDFADENNPRPLLRTPDDPDARTLVAFCFALVPREDTGAFGMHWRSGPRSMMRSAGSLLRPLQSPGRASKNSARRHPLTLVTGHGGGRWYNFYNHEFVGDDGYRPLTIDDAAGPLSIYHCNVEHVFDEEAQIEVRRGRQVTIYGMKSEGNSPALRATDSSDIRIFSYGGNLCPKPGSALFVFERTTGVVVANAIPRVTLPDSGIADYYKRDLGLGLPDTWSVVIDRPADGSRAGTRPLERPVLYRGPAATPPAAPSRP